MIWRALIVVCALALVAAAPQTTLSDVEDEVMCVVCGIPLNISESPQADRERAFIKELIAEGRTKDEIKRALVAEYGESVLSTPSDTSGNTALWLVPAVVLALLLAAGAVLVPRWRRKDRATPHPEVPELPAEDARRLDDDLARYR